MHPSGTSDREVGLVLVSREDLDLEGLLPSNQAKNLSS
jgi:hypothetical protein